MISELWGYLNEQRGDGLPATIHIAVAGLPDALWSFIKTLCSSLQLLTSLLVVGTAMNPGDSPGSTATTTRRAINCTDTSTTLEALVTCLVGYTVPAGFYDSDDIVGGVSRYAAAQPSTASERQAWRAAVANVLNINGDCPATAVDVAGLGGSYAMQRFTESTTSIGGRRGGRGASFCVLSETTTFPGTDSESSTGVFARGWGFVITTADDADHVRALHFSAPHPVHDSTTPIQAAALFKRVGAKSLVVAGRHRQASGRSSVCATPSDPASTTYYLTDPSHSDAEPFHDALVAVYDWQNARGGCPNSNCAYIQWHCKISCTNYDVFLSSGPGNGAASHAWYHGTTVRPVRRLKENLDVALAPLPGTVHGLPSISNDCQLTATKNIFGRIVNGRSPPEHCTAYAALSEVTGAFIHVEQSEAVLLESRWDEWALALNMTFPEI